MKIRGIAVLAVLVSTLLSACATSGPKFNEMAASMSPAKPDMGRIYFYRTTLLGTAVQPDVRLNGEVVGKAVPNGFFYADRPAGNYQVATETEVERKLTRGIEGDDPVRFDTPAPSSPQPGPRG